ncbi:uncharacterized protein MYCGRDRAFT_92656 [Zymoseptoria tritici IPO323]|uniref:Uncharacterized protein n=1 Tax=Zymoseptoria tritici (strain CBS 115943 / IPO323) TaxID=336722 RepID=F9X938_ZYMTI|nr:uncharacterized protein MYCGRDRAFT_92656 [Zymoseptoria tritici IPO323]EGP88341.1 hypothetical protein MYCGRDRAFT_92656 [Zymoseptoria tritici IPO323]
MKRLSEVRAGDDKTGLGSDQEHPTRRSAPDNLPIVKIPKAGARPNLLKRAIPGVKVWDILSELVDAQRIKGRSASTTQTVRYSSCLITRMPERQSDGAAKCACDQSLVWSRWAAGIRLPGNLQRGPILLADVDCLPDYFSITPRANNTADVLSVDINTEHLPADSPYYSPAPSVQVHSLLAPRPSITPTSTMASTGSFMQMQTSASHTPSRPQHIQNVLHVTSDDSTSSDSSSSSSANSALYSSPEFARCSRCHRASSIDWKTGQDKNMMRYGLNLWYCNRCASIVGMIPKG